MTPADILYETGPFWVCRGPKSKGFEVYKINGTHSVRVAIIGFEGRAGLTRASAEADRRASALPRPPSNSEAK